MKVTYYPASVVNENPCVYLEPQSDKDKDILERIAGDCDNCVYAGFEPDDGRISYLGIPMERTHE